MLLVVGIYFFILLGFLSKKTFKEEIQEKGLVLLSTYFLQPFLTFWGLMIKEIDANLILAPSLYLLVIFLALTVTYSVSRLFKDPKERSIVAVAALIGNTGNLGIPISYSLWGEEAVLFTTMINLANVLFVYTVGIFFYAKGKYSFKEAFAKIIRIPILWVGIIAVILNLNHVVLPKSILHLLEMGAYTTMVIQLMIFGIYLAQVRLSDFNLKLTLSVTSMKFLLLPFLGFMLFEWVKVDEIVYHTVLLELAVPLAVTNVNLAGLFDCKAIEVTMLIVITSVLFIFYLPILF